MLPITKSGFLFGRSLVPFRYDAATGCVAYTSSYDVEMYLIVVSRYGLFLNLHRLSVPSCWVSCNQARTRGLVRYEGGFFLC